MLLALRQRRRRVRNRPAQPRLLVGLRAGTASAPPVVFAQSAVNRTIADAPQPMFGVTGAVGALLDDVTIVAAAQVIVQAAANDNLSDASVAAAGMVVVQAAAADTLDAVTVVATGTVAVHGAAAVTLADATLVAGNAATSGTLAVTLDDAGASGTATTYTRPQRGIFVSVAVARPTPLASLTAVVVPALSVVTTGARAVTSLARSGAVDAANAVGASLLRTGPRVTLPVQDALPFINTHVTIPITLTYQGAVFTPTSLTLTVSSPDGERTVTNLGDAGMQNPATGSYAVEIVPSKAGTWSYAWAAVKADGRQYYDEDKIVVLSRRF